MHDETQLHVSTFLIYTPPHPHLAILCNLDLTILELTSVHKLRRNINSIDKQLFSLETKAELDSVGNSSAEQLHCCLRSILDSRASISSTIVRQHKYSPWYREICGELQVTKKIRHKAERHWLSLKMTFHKEISIAAKS